MKMTTALLTVIFITSAGFAQVKPTPAPDGDHTAPVEWKLYSVPSDGVSIKLPKLPLLNESDNKCDETRTRSYYAYANESVYELTVVTKEVLKNIRCEFKNSFGPDTIVRRYKRLTDYVPGLVSSTDIGNDKGKGREFRYEFDAVTEIRRVIPDLDNGRWFELSVHYRKDAAPDTDGYFSSFASNAADGVDIGEGSETMLGDAKGSETPPPRRNIKDNSSLALISNPMPRYTVKARDNFVEGLVELNVTFLANGSVGQIQVLKPLPDGLTEQSIAVTRQIVFLPQRKGGKPVDLTKKLAYKFNAY